MRQYDILIVEDDFVTRRCLVGLLQNLGHAVMAETDTAEESLQIMETLRPDVVLMDVQLAGAMDGVEAATRITREHHVPVIFLTGMPVDRIFEDDEQAIAVSYMLKPVEKSQLAVNIELAVRHHRMEKRLRESEARYRSLFTTAAAGIYKATPAGDLVNANDAFARMLGYEDAATMLQGDARIDVHYYEHEGRFAELVARLAREEELIGSESEVLGRDGDLLWIAEHLRAERDEGGDLAGVFGVAVDITDRKEAEASRSVSLNMLRQLVNSLAHPLALTDLEHELILTNEAFFETFPETVGPDGEERPLPAILPPAWRDAWTQEDAAFQQDHAPRVVSLPPAGATPAMQVSISPYLDVEQRVIGAVYVFQPAMPPARS